MRNKSEEKYFRAVVENTGDGIAILSMEGKPLYVSPSIKNILAYTPEQGMQLNLFPLVHPDDRNILKDVMKQVMANPGIAITGSPTRLKHKDGSWKWIDGVGTNMLNDPDINGIVYNYRDVTEKVLAEKILKDSEEKYHSFFSNNMDGILLSITDKELIAANPAACQMFQMTEEEICKAGVFGLVDPTDERVKVGIKERKKFGKAKTEVTLVRKNGSKFPAEVSGTVFKNSDGEERTSMIVRDLTEYKKNQKAISELQSNLQSIFDNTSEGFMLTDAKGIIKTYNDKAKDFIFNNVNSKIDVGSNISDFIHPDRKDYFNIVISKVLSGETINYDYSYDLIDGKTLWVNFIFNPVFNEGNIVGICITGGDITPRKEIEVALKQSELRYRQIVETAQEGIWLIDENSVTTFVNEKMCEILGYTQEEMIGKENLFFKDEEGKRLALKEIERRKQGIVESHDTSYITKTGKKILARVVTNPLMENGIYKGALAMVSDKTEKILAEEKLRQSEQNYRLLSLQLEVESKLLIEAQAIAKVGSWEKDLRTMESKWSEETYRIFETDPEKFTGDHNKFLQFIHPEDRQEAIFTFENLVKNNTPYSFIFRIITPNGNIKFIKENWEIHCDVDGVPSRAIGACQDVTESKLAEEKIKKSEQEQRLLSFELQQERARLIEAQGIAKIGSWETDLESYNVKWSAENHRIFGTTPDAFTPTHAEFLKFVHPQDRTDVDSAFTNCLSSHSINKIEHRIITAKGNEKHVVENWEIFYDEVGKPIRAMGTCQDITEQKLADAKLKIISDELAITSERLLLATTSAKIGVWDWDVANDIMTWDDRMFELYGIEKQSFTGNINIWGKAVHPDDRVRAGKELNNALTGILDYHTEFRVIWPDKSVHFIESNAIVTRDEKGVAVRMIGINTDITERKKAEEEVLKLNEEVAKSEKFFKGVIESSADMITILDATGKTLYASPAVAKNFGYTNEECLNFNLAEVVHPDDALITQETVAKAMMNPGLPLETPLIRNKKKDGTYIWVEGTLTNFLETEGINAIVANFRDITERKKAEEENRFKANLLSTIGQAAIATDISGIITYWNQAAENIYGWTNEEALGKHILELTPSEATKEQAIEILEKLKEGQTWSGEFKVQKKDGTNFPAMITNSPIYNEHNILSGIIGVSSDITEKKKLQELFDKASTLAHIGSYEVDLVGNTLYWSSITKQIHGVGENYIPDLTTAINFYKEGFSRQSITESLQKAIEEGVPFDVELQIVTAKGNERWVRAIGEGEFVNDKCIKVTGSFQDIDKAKHAELEILNAYEEKNVILESIGDAFIALDKDWIVTYWNKHAEKVFFKKKEETIDKKLWDVFPRGVHTTFHEQYKNALSENKAQHFETYIDKLDSWYEISAYPANQGLSVYFKDITKRKVSELQVTHLNSELQKHVKDLAISNKELEDFAYVASHDLQEPLRMVTGFLGQIEKKYSDIIDDRGKQYIHFAVDGAKRMRQIILDLLEYSRIGRGQEKEEIIDLNEIVQSVVLLCQKQINETKTIISFENLPSIKSYRTPLRQLFQNLLSNAIKYGKKEVAPLIKISAEERETHWQFSINDNGIGIEEEYFNKIFVIFQRLHNKDEYSGTGLGLAICKKITDNLGGKIWLQSKEGEGSTFYFSIPKNLKNNFLTLEENLN